MNHLILGAGNLGKDLDIALREVGEETELLSHSLGTDVTHPSFFSVSFQEPHPDYIWCCVGCGGPSDDLETNARQLELLTALPMRINALKGPHTKLILFSTHYLNMDKKGERSFYAKAKRMMEEQLACEKNVRVYRVGSLYGVHKPLATLPGKVISRLESGQEIFGALNDVTPTPTRWLAQWLVSALLEESIELNLIPLKIGPSGSVCVREWIEAIADMAGFPEVKFSEEDYDPMYHKDSKSHARGEQNWRALWKEYGPPVIERARLLSRCR